MSAKAIILGAKKGSMNIGDVTDEFFKGRGWDTETHDCLITATGLPSSTMYYGVPQDLDYENAAALIVTLGRTSMTPFDRVSPEELKEVIYGCLTLPILAARKYVEQRENHGGNIVFIGSYAHRHPFSTGTAYCSAKAGLDMATKTLAWEVTDKGYQVNCVHPYHVVGTPMWEEVQEGVMRNKNMTREEADEYAYKDAKMPLIRPGEIAAVIYNLCNNYEWTWSSGSSIELYGGTR